MIPELLLLNGLKALPDDCDQEMLWLFEHEGVTFLFGLWKDAHGWMIYEYHEGKAWDANCEVSDRQAGIDWVRHWSEDFAPDYHDKYFPKPRLH